MAVKRKLAVGFGALLVLVVVFFAGQRIRADRADARVNRILGEAEVAEAEYLRDTFRTIIDDVDSGRFLTPGGEIDADTLEEDPRFQTMCEIIIDIDSAAIDAVQAMSAKRRYETYRRLMTHHSFLSTSADFAFYGALYDSGMITGEPPEPPFENLDHLLKMADLRGLTIESDGILNGLEAFGTAIDIIPVLVYPDCVLRAYEVDRISAQPPKSTARASSSWSSL